MAEKENRSINPDASRQFANSKKQEIQVDTLIQGILSGDRVALGKAITYIESENQKHQEIASLIIEKCLPHTDQALRIGITGSPGVGKSTFIETLGKHIISQGKKLAVLAVDPSSQISKGSILGDKTRMQELAANELAFIRPSPAGTALGGVARKTRETIILCEAAGYDTIFIETVGVGQSEITVHSMVDCFLLLLLPGAGDDLQGIKRGIVEMADLLIVNKADGDREKMARDSMKAYKAALHLFPASNIWAPKVMTCSALKNQGIQEIWETIGMFKSTMIENGQFELTRNEQSKFWLNESIKAELRNRFFNDPNMQSKIESMESDVINGKISPFRAANDLMNFFFEKGQ